MSDLAEAYKACIASSLTDIQVSDLSPDDQECSICQQSLVLQPKAEDISCIGPPTRLPCGHIFGKACVMEWLVKHRTCRFCRFDIEGVVWHIESTKILNSLEPMIQLHDQTEYVGRGARRLRDFILRVTTEGEMPCEPICMVIRNLARGRGS